jgi:hypothetical protein
MPRRSAASLSVLSVVGPEPRLLPPPEMGGIERQIWMQVVAGTGPNHFQASDAPLLGAYVRACALERRASDELAISVVQNGAPSSWLAVHGSAVRSMVSSAVKLRQSPKGRTPGQRAGEAQSISRESAGEDGEGLPVRRHSGGWPRRILDRSRAAE